MASQSKVEEAAKLLRQGLSQLETSKRLGITTRTLRRWRSLGKFGTLDLVIGRKVRPRILSGRSIKVVTGCGNLYVTLNRDGSELFEVFATLGKSGGCSSCQNEALTRAITLGLRCGIPKVEFVRELRGIQCPNPKMFPIEDRVLSCSDAIAKVIEEEG